MTWNRNSVLLIVALVCFVLATLAAEVADNGEILLTAAGWIGAGLASLAAAMLPLR